MISLDKIFNLIRPFFFVNKTLVGLIFNIKFLKNYDKVLAENLR